MGLGFGLRALVLCFLVCLFFVFMAGLDFVVHKVLYGFGLCFSYDWAVFYWAVFGCVFFVFSVVVGFVYWFGSGKSRRDVGVSFCLFLSVFLFFVGGLVDVFWFVFWDGGLPGGDVVWWWMPWCAVFGFWNSVLQLVLLGGVFVVVGLVWVVVLRFC